MRVLLAFDKFKDALTASRACAIAREALTETHSDWVIDECPLTDGGDGFAEILTHAAGGDFETCAVSGPRGGEVRAAFGSVRLEKIPPAAREQLRIAGDGGHVAVLDLPSASGLSHLPRADRDPWQTTTFGTGELMRAAAASKPAAILVGIGGSATNDLGLGALAALGWEFLDESSEVVSPPIPATWSRIARLRRGATTQIPPVFVACDVTNPLLGPRGCAAVYGPQKGLAAQDVSRLDHESARLALMLCACRQQPDTLMDEPGAGAAGGFAFGLRAGLGATIVPGFDLVSTWLNLDRRIGAADLVITGEGRFDASSLTGKGPGAIVARAQSLGRRTEVFAGSIGVSGEHLHAISPTDWPLERALAETPSLLRAALRRMFG